LKLSDEEKWTISEVAQRTALKGEFETPMYECVLKLQVKMKAKSAEMAQFYLHRQVL